MRLVRGVAEATLIMLKSEFEREGGEVAKSASLSSILEHYEYIEELGFKEHHIFANNELPLYLPSTNRCQLLPTFGRRWIGKERLIRVAISWRMSHPMVRVLAQVKI